MEWTQDFPEETETEQLLTDKAIDWLLAVRKYGLERANEMFPEES